jgi:hypothetical protein
VGNIRTIKPCAALGRVGEVYAVIVKLFEHADSLWNVLGMQTMVEVCDGLTAFVSSCGQLVGALVYSYQRSLSRRQRVEGRK